MALQLLHYSDLEIAYDDPESIGRLVATIDRERTPDTVVIGTGDNTAPGALPLARKGRQATAFFEAVGADVDVPGNHDFDFGVDQAREHVRETPQTWVAANAYEGDERFAGDAGLVPWTIVETHSYRVGIVGIAHPGTDRMNPRTTDLTFEPARPAARRAAEAVRAEGVDAVVLAAHVGSGTSDGTSGRDLARSLDVDAVLDGHDHASTVAVTDDGTPYVRPGKGADTVVAVELDDDVALRSLETDEYDPDRSLVADLQSQARAAGLTETVAHVDEPIDCSATAADAGESRIGNLVTDAFRAAAGADLAIIAPEGIRSQPPLDGDLTVWDVHSLVPFGGDLVSIDLPGDRLLDVLTELSADHVAAWPDWTFGHVSGGQLIYDGEGGGLIEASVNGEPVDTDRRYRLATSEYYVQNEDLFPSLRPGDVIDRHGPQYEVITEYVRGLDRVPPIQNRIRRLPNPAPDRS